MKDKSVFLIDCPSCRAVVAALENGRAERTGYWDEDSRQPWGQRVQIGICPNCGSILAGLSEQVDFQGVDAEEDRWAKSVRIFPKPPKTFNSLRIPHTITESLEEAERCLNVNSHMAACVMFGRALEALCRDVLASGKPTSLPTKKTKPIMLGQGIEQLYKTGTIDKRLYDWSKQLHGFRNLAAHPDDLSSISQEDAEDLKTFVYAIVEYIYDLADRYDEFMSRVAQKKKPKKP